MLCAAALSHPAPVALVSALALLAGRSKPSAKSSRWAEPLPLLCSFRCLPDVLVIGEVRCGTTTVATHLKVSCALQWVVWWVVLG